MTDGGWRRGARSAPSGCASRALASGRLGRADWRTGDAPAVVVVVGRVVRGARYSSGGARAHISAVLPSRPRIHLRSTGSAPPMRSARRATAPGATNVMTTAVAPPGSAQTSRYPPPVFCHRLFGRQAKLVAFRDENDRHLGEILHRNRKIDVEPRIGRPDKIGRPRSPAASCRSRRRCACR